MVFNDYLVTALDNRDNLDLSRNRKSKKLGGDQIFFTHFTDSKKVAVIYQSHMLLCYEII